MIPVITTAAATVTTDAHAIGKYANAKAIVGVVCTYAEHASRISSVLIHLSACVTGMTDVVIITTVSGAIVIQDVVEQIDGVVLVMGQLTV